MSNPSQNTTHLEEKSPIENALEIVNHRIDNGGITDGYDRGKMSGYDDMRETLQELLPSDQARSQRILELERDWKYEKIQNQNLLDTINSMEEKESQLEKGIDLLIEENKSLQSQLAEKDKEIERVKSLIEQAHIRGWQDFPDEYDLNTHANTWEGSWNQFKQDNQL